MMIRVALVGYDLVGKRIADAVARQEDMELAGVWDDDPQRRRLVAAQGFRLVEDDGRPSFRDSDVAVVCREDWPVRGVPVVYASHLSVEQGVLFSPLTPPEHVFNQPHVRVALPDVIGLARLVQAVARMARIERLYANVITRAGHATQQAAGSADALEPLPADGPTTSQLDQVLGHAVGRVYVSRVRAPYTHSHLHTIQLDLDVAVERQAVLDALHQTPRVLIASAADGFISTADVQEFFRNSRRRSDRPELFVWEESVISDKRRLYLLADVCQEATSIPETIDAIRLSKTPSLDLGESIRRTDAALGIGRFGWGTRESGLLHERPDGDSGPNVAVACSRGAARGHDNGAEHA